MLNNYSTFYARQQFTITGAVPDALKLRVYVDDGAIVYINGFELPRFHVTAGNKNFNGTTGETGHEAIWEEVILTGASQYLVLGTNTIAVHVLNQAVDNSDASFNLELSIPDDDDRRADAGRPELGVRRQRGAADAAAHAVGPAAHRRPGRHDHHQGDRSRRRAERQPGVSARQSGQLHSHYRRRATTPSWTTLAMHDDGLNGDAVAGDGVYSVVLPGSLQTNRRLVRYRITATDALGASIRGPYADDPQPNFAYFVYNGVPNYTASLRPGVLPNVVYDGAKLDDLATYHLIANATDVQNSQYNAAVQRGAVPRHDRVRRRRVRPRRVPQPRRRVDLRRRQEQVEDRVPHAATTCRPATTTAILTPSCGTRSTSCRARIPGGGTTCRPTARCCSSRRRSSCTSWPARPSPTTHYFQFRVIDAASETGANQYGGDFWGLYIGIEQPDGSFLDERGLPDGNIYNMHGGAFGATNQRHQGSESRDRPLRPVRVPRRHRRRLRDARLVGGQSQLGLLLRLEHHQPRRQQRRHPAQRERQLLPQPGDGPVVRHPVGSRSHVRGRAALRQSGHQSREHPLAAARPSAGEAGVRESPPRDHRLAAGQRRRRPGRAGTGQRAHARHGRSDDRQRQPGAVGLPPAEGEAGHLVQELQRRAAAQRDVRRAGRPTCRTS